MKMHYRNVKFVRIPWLDERHLSITIPCGSEVPLTSNTTKNIDKVTCKRCKHYIKINGVKNDG